MIFSYVYFVITIYLLYKNIDRKTRKIINITLDLSFYYASELY